jgi:PTS system mannose-specific IIA component
MVGVLIIAHGSLAQSLLEGAQHVLGAHIRQINILGVHHQEDPDALRSKASLLIEELNDGHGVLVLTDLYGGTPSNIAKSLHDGGQVEVVSGVSLPMLVRALWYRDHALEEVVNKAMAGGLGGVIRMGWDT